PPSSRPCKARRGTCRARVPPRATHALPTRHRATHERTSTRARAETRKEETTIATSRTGTTAWRRTRALAIRYARRDGIEHCPSCSTRLDFDTPQTPASAEADHIIPFSKGGKDVIS